MKSKDDDITSNKMSNKSENILFQDVKLYNLY